MLSPSPHHQEPATGPETLLEQLALPLWIVDRADHHLCFLNPAAERLYGASASDLSQYSLFSLFEEEDSLRLLGRLASDEGGEELLQARHRQGQRLMVRIHAAPIRFRGRDCWQLLSVDLTPLMHSLHNLSEEKKRYQSYIGQSSEGIYCQELSQPIPIETPLDEMVRALLSQALISECNESLARMYGYAEPAELLGRSTGDLVDVSDPVNQRFLEDFVRGGFKVMNAESHEHDREGRDLYFINNAIGIVEDGCLRRVWGTQRDITQQKKAEQKIRFLASLVEQTSDVLTASDLNYRPITWNRAAEKVYGLSAEEAIGKDLGSLLNASYNGLSREEVRETVSREGEWKGEMNFTRPADGCRMILLISFRLLRDEADHPLGYVIGAKDITERKASELLLRESESRFRDIADSAPVMIWISNEHDRITYVNKPLRRQTGFQPEKGELWSDQVHPDEAEVTRSQFERHFETREPSLLTYRLRHEDGSYRWVQESGIPRYLNNGRFIGYIGSVVDIHELKRKESQLRYQASILENVSDIIITTDLDYRVVSWNSVAEKYYNLTAGEAIGRPLSSLVRVNFGFTSLRESIDHLQRHGLWAGELSHTANGRTRYFHYTGTHLYGPDEQRSGVLFVGRDITQTKMAEQKLLNSEQFFRALIADSLDGMVLTDMSGHIHFASPSIRNVLGYEPEEVIRRNVFDFVHPEDLEWAVASFQKELHLVSPVKFMIARVRRKDGEWQWTMIRGNNLLDNSLVRSMVIYFHDDTPRKKASEALKESELRFRSLIRDLDTGVLLQDAEGKVVMSNNAMSTLFHRSEEDLRDHTIWELFPDVIREDGTPIHMTERPSYRARETRRMVRDVVMGVAMPGRKERTWILVTANPTCDEEGKLVNIVCSFTNITERKKLENELISKRITYQRQLTQATIDAQEHERSEIGKELHDNIGQQLTTVKLFLDMARETASETTAPLMSMAQKSVLDVINEVRAMSRSLVPSTLRDLGLADSIQEHIDAICRSHPLRIEFRHLDFDEENIPENKKISLFRIVQEQLNRVLHRGAASWIEIRLRAKEGFLLEIHDNGGLKNQRPRGEDSALTSMRNRAELLGGSAELTPVAEGGWLLRVWIP